MKKTYLLLALLLLTIIVVVALELWTGSERTTSPWSELSKRNLEFREDQFIQFVISNDPEVVQLYLDVGMDANVKLKNGNYPIILAAAHNSSDVLDLLIQNGANVNAVYRREITPLVAAIAGELSMSDLSKAAAGTVHKADKKIVGTLLKSGANPNVNGYTLMMLAIRHAAKYQGDLSILRLLIEHDLDVNSTPKWGKPCLYLALEAVERGISEEIIKLLLDAGANPNAPLPGNNKQGLLAIVESQKFQLQVGLPRAQKIYQLLQNGGALN